MRKVEDRIVARMSLPPGPLEPGSVWTPKVVDERIDDAAYVLKQLPTGMRRRITLQIDVVRAASDAYGYTDASARVIPDSARIARAEQALLWLNILSQRDRVLVWSRAEGIKWKHLEKRLGYTERRLTTFRRNAILQIVAHLNRAPVARAT